MAVQQDRALIVLADDNEASCMAMVDYLEAQGCRLVVARDGYQAVALARQCRLDLILMDVQMPGMDGLEATRQIRSDPALARVPILALTALAMPSDAERCLAAGADGYLSKPVGLRDLFATIRQNLNTKHM